MDSAEALFMRLGYDGTSVRAIAARAKVSLGTIVYHWGTKENLFREVCLRRVSNILKEQTRRLRICEREWREPVVENLEPVLRALIEPPLLTFKAPSEAETTRMLYGIMLTDPSPVVLKVTAELFQEPADLYLELVRRSLPDLEHEDFYWRYICAMGAFVFAQSFGYRVAYAAHIDELETDWAVVADQIVAFMVAGMKRAD